jgi:hypothetical protein
MIMRNIFLGILSAYRANFSPKYSDSKTDIILKELDQNAISIYRQFLSPKEVTELRNVIYKYTKQKNLESQMLELTAYTRNRYTLQEEQFKYLFKSTNGSIFSEITEKFYGATTACNKIIYEVKTPGNPKIIKGEYGINPDASFHTDKPFRSLKVAILLSDVEQKDGPFCLFKKSHRHLRSKSPIKRLRALFIRYFFKGEGSIFMFDADKDYMYIDYKDEIIFTGKAGDLAFFNSEAIHKGSELASDGHREMIFMMFYNNSISDRFEKQLTFIHKIYLRYFKPL